MPGYEAASWHGALAPRGLPVALLKQLNRDINAALLQDANKERLLREGLEVVGSTPEEFGTQIRTEIQRWKKVVQTAGIPVE